MKIISTKNIVNLDSLDYNMNMISNRWQVQTAKNKLSEVIEKSRNEGPQIITRHGENAAVIISYEEYKKHAKPKRTLVDLFREYQGAFGPDGFDDLIERDRTTPDRATPVDFEDI